MDADCRCDLISGRDFCSKHGMVLDFETHAMHALDREIKMRIVHPAPRTDASLVDTQIES